MMIFLMVVGTGLLSLLHLTEVFMVAPLVQGVIKKGKARGQRRLGAPLLQPYGDLAKYFAKAEVVSEHSSWITRITPYLVFGCMGAAALGIPLLNAAPLPEASDLLVLMAIFALANVFTALAGLDGGSAFGGMGSSREMMVAVLVEPAFLLVIAAIALPTGTTNLSEMMRQFTVQGFALLSPAHLLAAFAFGLLVIAETGRLPVDNPDTHLELTMIHEGMLLEYSGRSLALMIWAVWIKQVLMISLFVNLFLPWGATSSTDPWSLVLNSVFSLGKIFLVALILGGIEMLAPKLRLFRLTRFFRVSFLVAFLAILAEYIVR
jgi:formate hydrogenlyase subunit 4